MPLSEYASKLEEHVKQRYLQKISSIGVDPVLIEGKRFEPDCLPPVESTDLLFHLALETSFYTQQQFKAFCSLQAYNQIVSGCITSVQGHILADKCVVFGQSATFAKNEQCLNSTMDNHREARYDFCCSLYGMYGWSFYSFLFGSVD